MEQIAAPDRMRLDCLRILHWTKRSRALVAPIRIVRIMDSRWLHLKVATTADQFVLALRLNVPAYCPLTDTICPSVAALEVLGGASCNNIWNPVPAVAVAVELLDTPSPANTSSLLDAVVAVRPVFGDVPEPCAWAVWSSMLAPVYSNIPIQG